MDKDFINTVNHGERVTSAYAEIYFDDNCCGFQWDEENLGITQKSSHKSLEENVWKSPSDLIIGNIELKPPLTSKITRGKTHEGILNIGNGILEIERHEFLLNLETLIRDNDAAWTYVLDHERKSIFSKVQVIYDKIFLDKSNIMLKEMTKFYENTLQQLEYHMRSEIQEVLVTVHANIMSDLNIQIRSKLENEKQILDKILKKRLKSEIQKVAQYYKLLLDNELYRNNKLINQALHERNDFLKAFLRQVEADNLTSTMYVMCAERKKCKIKQFILDSYQTIEISEKIKKIKERQAVIDDYKKREVTLAQINTEWEGKIKKLLKLFLKFISFALKLLPEQTTFLLDFEKMVVLQLNEIQKTPNALPILMDDNNVFKFEEHNHTETICNEDPFIVVGDESVTPPRIYGSRESIPFDVDIPYLRVNRQFIYAKCHKFEEIKAFLESQRCKCSDIQTRVPLNVTPPEEALETECKESQYKSESSIESLLIDDFSRFDDCPVRKCKDWVKKISFPYLDSYLDYTEEKFETMKAVVGKPPEKDVTPELISAKDVVYREMPFAATKERYHHVETQCSSTDDLTMPDILCPCTVGSFAKQESFHTVKETSSKLLNEILTKRKYSLQRLMRKNPKLLKIFTDECFDFQL